MTAEMQISNKGIERAHFRAAAPCCKFNTPCTETAANTAGKSGLAGACE